jgi:pimeloyl-ACP methyl ester carboxylesterase
MPSDDPLAIVRDRLPDNSGFQWMVLPATPALPDTARSGLASVNGIKLWHAVYGEGPPVILLHGSLANANYWGYQVPALIKDHQVIVMDSRGHGRSTNDERPYSYRLMADDVLGLMDYLKIEEAAVVGWSDGANLGLDLAINHPDRVSRLFAFAAHTYPIGARDPEDSPTFNAYLARTAKEYAALSPTPYRFQSFKAEISKLRATEPIFTADQLKRIRAMSWIVDGTHDEAIKRENTLFMADQIPGAILVIQPRVGYFSFLQDPKQFNNDVLVFLEDGP